MNLKPTLRFASVIAIAFSFLALTSNTTAQEAPAKKAPTKPAAQKTPAALNFTMKSIAGEDVKLSKYAGKVVVFVNVASKCGFTPQYKQLQELHSKYAAKGVAVVGIPCNQFKGQEPGSDKEIHTFCKNKYGVDFDLMSKVDVNGDKQCDLYLSLIHISEPTRPY